MKKRAFLLSPLIGLIATPSYSQAMSENKGTLTITPSYASTNMFRGVRYGGLSFQPTIEYSKGPLSLSLPTSFPVSDKIDGVCDPEIDLTASYTWDIVPNKFTIKPGFWIYGYPRAYEDTYKFQFEPNIAFGYTFKDIVFSLNFYYDLVFQGGGYELGLDYSIPIKPLDIELSALFGSFDQSNTTNEPVKVRNKGDYFQAGISIPYEFSSKSKLIFGWCYTKGMNNYTQKVGGVKESNPDAVGCGVFQLSFSQSF